MPPTIVVVFLGVFVVVGCVVFVSAVWIAYRSLYAATWPTTPGMLLDVHTETTEGDEDNAPAETVKVRYAYEMDGIRHTGSRVAFGYHPSSLLKVHDEIEQCLRDAQIVMVRYNPRNPSVSCLAYGLHHTIQMMLVFGCMWFVISIGAAYLASQVYQSDSVLIQHLTVE